MSIMNATEALEVTLISANGDFFAMAGHVSHDEVVEYVRGVAKAPVLIATALHYTVYPYDSEDEIARRACTQEEAHEIAENIRDLRREGRIVCEKVIAQSERIKR